MTKFNPEFIKRLAMGDGEAFEQIEGLPVIERMSIGAAVEELRRTENIVPMSAGMSIYAEKESSYNEEGVVEAMRLKREREEAAREHAEKIREEFIAKQVKAAVERSRSGLPSNGPMPQ